MKKIVVIIAIIAVFIVGCHPKSEVCCQLANIDSLLYNNCVDSANAILKDIEPLNKEDSAYFFVLKAETDYRQKNIPNLDEIDYSITFYETHIDNRKLANAYYYKACTFIMKKSLTKDCFILLKQAEETAEKTSDNNLKNKICAALTYANHAKNQIEEAIKYATKEYFYAQKLNCRHDIAYALVRLAICHKHFGQKDSAEHYIMQCKALVNEVDNSDKSFVYNLLGECFMNENLDAATQYFNTALKYNKNSETYSNLAKIYLTKKDTLNWQKYCDSALSNAWYKTKIDILSDIAQRNYDANNIAAYKKTTDSLAETWKKFMVYEKTNFALEIQRKFDFEKQQTIYERNIWIFVAIVCFLVVISLGFLMVYKHNLHKIKMLERDNILLYDRQNVANATMDEYKAQLDYLQNQNEELSLKSDNLSNIISANEGMIATLKSKVDEMNEQNMKFLAIGKNIFDLMKGNKPIVDFKTQYVHCLYYFETTYPAETKIFSPYSNLTIENKVFLICDDYMHKQDDEMSKIFDISQTTVRTRRSKMKGKMS